METILCAAIYLQTAKKHPGQPKNIESGIVVIGHNHATCMVNIGNFKLINFLNSRIDGFLTSNNRFVDRVDAMELCKINGQINKDQFTNELTSQILYNSNKVRVDEEI